MAACEGPSQNQGGGSDQNFVCKQRRQTPSSIQLSSGYSKEAVELLLE